MHYDNDARRIKTNIILNFHEINLRPPPHGVRKTAGGSVCLGVSLQLLARGQNPNQEVHSEGLSAAKMRYLLKQDFAIKVACLS